MARKLDKRTESWNRQRWQQETLKVFQAMIRWEAAVDGWVQCVTCQDKYPVENSDGMLNAGHYAPRQFGRYVFDERNVYPQCSTCNRPEAQGGRAGATDEMYLFIRTVHGEEVAEELRQAKFAKTKAFPYSIEELQEMRAEYRERLKRAKENNVNN